MSTRLLQLASPALPVGAYSYSQGLNGRLSAATWSMPCRRSAGSRITSVWSLPASKHRSTPPPSCLAGGMMQPRSYA